MQLMRIPGYTDVLGENQDEYLNLYVKRIILVDHVTGEVIAPAMVSAWEPSPEEIGKIVMGASIHIRVLGDVHPPVMVLVGDVPE